MSHRNAMRCTVYVLAALSLAGPLAACGTQEPPPAFNAPATLQESMILGVDATDSYFLHRFRRCVQWKSQQVCAKEPYGDDEGGFH